MTPTHQPREQSDLVEALRAEHEQEMSELRKYFENVCAELEAKYRAEIEDSSKRQVGGSVTPAWQLLIDVVTDIGRAGQQAGAVFTVEAGGSSPEELTRLLAAVPAGSLQVDLVTGGLLVHGHDPAAAAATLAADVGFVHATDAMPGAFFGHGRPVPLGTGQLDLPAVLATLDERGYRGWGGLEAIATSRAEAVAELAAGASRLLG